MNEHPLYTAGGRKILCSFRKKSELFAILEKAFIKKNVHKSQQQWGDTRGQRQARYSFMEQLNLLRHYFSKASHLDDRRSFRWPL